MAHNFSFNQHMQSEIEHTHTDGQKITQNLPLKFAGVLLLSIFFYLLLVRGALFFPTYEYSEWQTEACCDCPAWSAFDGQRGSREVSFLQPCAGGRVGTKRIWGEEQKGDTSDRTTAHLEGKEIWQFLQLLASQEDAWVNLNCVCAEVQPQSSQVSAWQFAPTFISETVSSRTGKPDFSRI